MPETQSAKKSIMIPEDLYMQIEKAIDGKGFTAVDDYVIYHLRILVGKNPIKPEAQDNSHVIEQLKALGYI